MAEQLDHLVEMAQRPSILIEVIPLDVGAHEGVNGAFVIADFADAPSIVHLETTLTGLVVERPEDMVAVTLSYETLRPRCCRVPVPWTSRRKYGRHGPDPRRLAQEQLQRNQRESR
jgi:hypothetical protein